MIKPILFNSEMVKAIMDGRKTVTRRICKVNPYDSSKETGGAFAICETNSQILFVNEERFARWLIAKSKIKAGDILWVRETWAHILYDDGEPCDRFVYKASDEAIDFELTQPDWKWHPSIHMPKPAARIFLRVTDMRTERLWEIDENESEREGVRGITPTTVYGTSARNNFETLWNSTIKPADLYRYGWDANPWVWVISFERTEKPEDFA